MRKGISIFNTDYFRIGISLSVKSVKKRPLIIICILMRYKYISCQGSITFL